MPSARSNDGKLLLPWALDDSVIATWNRYGSQELGFRVYTDGKANSRPKAAARLTYILRDNAHLLGGSKRSDIEWLLDSFDSQLMFSLLYIKQQGTVEVARKLGSAIDARLTFWSYTRDCRAMKTLSDLYLGRAAVDDIVDLQRRQRKAELLREFSSDVKEFARRAAYLSGSDEHSNQRLEQALELARQALAQAEDDLQWMAA
jgi:hypothetical protein